MIRRFSLTLAITFMLPLSSLAQVSTATLQGTVKDQTGAALPGVTVTVIHTGTGASRNVVTDAGGRYVVAPLPIGGYEVRAELTGFRTEVRRGITLAVGMQAVVDLLLSVGSLQEKVEVTAEAPRVQTTSSAVSELVDSKTMRELPMNGRRAGCAIRRPANSIRSRSRRRCSRISTCCS